MKSLVSMCSMCVCGSALLLSSTSATAALFEETFDSRSTPGVNSGYTGTSTTYLDPAHWYASGNSNYGRVQEAADGFFRGSVGTSSNQFAQWGTTDTGLGFNGADTVRYEFDVLDHNFGGSPATQSGQVRVMVKQGASSWFSTSYAFGVVYTNADFFVVIKDNAGGSHNGSSTLWSGEYTGEISHVQIDLDQTGYAVSLDGVGSLTTLTGSSSGLHGLTDVSQFDDARFALELVQTPFGGTPRNPFTIDIDNVSVSLVPEPSSLGLIGAGILCLLRRRAH